MNPFCRGNDFHVQNFSFVLLWFHCTGTDINQFVGRVDEYGRTVASEERLWSSLCSFAVSHSFFGNRFLFIWFSRINYTCFVLLIFLVFSIYLLCKYSNLIVKSRLEHKFSSFSRFSFLLGCSDGRSRAGVYCAANACIEQVIQHGEVDVFQAVKTVRRHRPQLIDNMVWHECF